MAPALNYESKATHAARRKPGNSKNKKSCEEKLSKKLIFISFLFGECQKRWPKSDKKQLTKGSFINNTLRPREPNGTHRHTHTHLLAGSRSIRNAGFDFDPYRRVRSRKSVKKLFNVWALCPLVIFHLVLIRRWPCHLQSTVKISFVASHFINKLNPRGSCLKRSARGGDWSAEKGTLSRVFFRNQWQKDIY